VQTTPETAALLSELYERASIVTKLDGPQLEAWVSGLFPVFDDHVTAVAFVEHCAAAGSDQGSLLVAAIAELTSGLDPATTTHAMALATGTLPAAGAGIGSSELTSAWSVTAKFGKSIVLGFDNHAFGTADVIEPEHSDDEPGELGDNPNDLRHSILVELDDQGQVIDLQLTGPAKVLLDEVTASDDRVIVAEMTVAEAVDAVVRAWPTADAAQYSLGAGFEANQQFVRRRMLVASGQVLPLVRAIDVPVDVHRGMSDADYRDANRAALSTLQAAVGLPDSSPDDDAFARHVAAWVSVIRGDVADVAPRERDALLWLEWADWLGAGIGLYRAGAETAADGNTLVDHVNRCPEVSSSIDKADRDYAEWAFDVALDLLQDRGVITDDRRLTAQGHASLRHGLVAAWN